MDMVKASEIFIKTPLQVAPGRIEKAMQRALVTVEQAAAQQREIFAERLRTLRKNAGLTQAQLAEKAGMTASVIARYETGKAMPRQKAIEKLAAALNVAPAALDINITDVYGGYIDTALLRRHGVNVRIVQPGLYALSFSGCPEIAITASDLSDFWDSCSDETMKAFTKVMENHFVNLLMRELYERNAADQNASDTPPE